MQEQAERQLLPGQGRGKGKGRGRGRGKGRGKGKNTAAAEDDTKTTPPADANQAPRVADSKQDSKTDSTQHKASDKAVDDASMECHAGATEKPKTTRKRKAAPKATEKAEQAKAPDNAEEAPDQLQAAEKKSKTNHSDHPHCWNKHGKHQQDKLTRRAKALEGVKKVQESGVPDLMSKVQGEFDRVILNCTY